MAPPGFAIEPLAREHDRSGFFSGHEGLDRYLKEQAGQDARKRVAAPFVLHKRGSKAIVGYYTLSMTAIYIEDLPEDVVLKLPKYPRVPATLLGRLAIHQECRGQGLGGLLLVDAMKRSLRSEIAWVAFVVDAMDDQACAFYEHYGFARFRDMSSRMFMMKKTIEQAFKSAD